MTFSLLIGLKNNLAYTRYVYAQTRLLYPQLEIAFVSYNSTDGTHEWLDSLRDSYVRFHHEAVEKTLSDTYNKATELATSEYVIFAHNDMVLAPGFIEALERLQTENRVVSYTTVEPPIFAYDERPGKLVRDFGDNLDTFQRDAFFAFADQQQCDNRSADREVDARNKPSFFLSVSRRVLLGMGGLDPLFNPMFCEDDDLLLRFQLKGLEPVVSLNAICYHFVSKTSRFSVEYQQRTQQIEARSNRNFIRKWGFRNNGSVRHTYDVGLVVTNASADTLRQVEPWCRTVYTDADVDSYLLDEQLNTAIDLRKKFKRLTDPITNGIIVTMNARRVPADSLESLPTTLFNRINTPPGLLKRLLTRVRFLFRRREVRIRIIDPASHERQLINR
jgi:GT2 family glycosyltransferase